MGEADNTPDLSEQFSIEAAAVEEDVVNKPWKTSEMEVAEDERRERSGGVCGGCIGGL